MNDSSRFDPRWFCPPPKTPPKINVDAAQQGRIDMRKRCAECAATSTPSNVVSINFHPQLSTSTNYAKARPGHYIINTPRPLTRRALRAFLTECACIALGDWSWSAERRRERWLRQRFKEFGISCPRKIRKPRTAKPKKPAPEINNFPSRFENL